MQRSLTVLVAALVAALSAEGANAQVQGVCVSGCNIPSPSAPAVQMPPDPRFNIIGAHAVEVEGDVRVRTPDGRILDGRVAFAGAVPLGSKVFTGPGAKMIILLPDETAFHIGPISEMTLDEFVYDPVTSAGKVSASVVKGNFRFITGKVARKNPENMKVKLNVGNLGFRGTDVDVNADPGGSGYVLVNKGEIYLAEYDTGRVFTVQVGHRLRYENFQIVGVE